MAASIASIGKSFGNAAGNSASDFMGLTFWRTLFRQDSGVTGWRAMQVLLLPCLTIRVRDRLS